VELTYDGITPVRVYVRRREQRLEVTDAGGAVAAARVSTKNLALPDQIRFGQYSVNVSRKGVVSLPGTVSQPREWLAKLQELVAEGSLALYEALLETAD